MSYLSIQNVSKRYDQTLVLDDIDLSVEKGEFVTLLGPSGCGKSTLLRGIAGLNHIDQGKIILNQRDITHLPSKKRNIAMVFQHYALFPNMTVADNVGFGLKMKRMKKADIQQKVGQMLELVELADFASRYPHQLSGGQCQRVALARALIMEPDLLLLDEPLSALDARIRRHLREEIRRIQRQLNITTLFVTHDQEEALIISDKIIVMNQGKVVQHNSPEEIYMSPESHFSAGFIGHYNILSAQTWQDLIGIQSQAKHIAIRPEIIEIVEVGQGIDALIINRTLMGNIIRYETKSNQGTVLQVDCLNTSSASLLPIGQTVGLQIKQEQVCELG